MARRMGIGSPSSFVSRMLFLLKVFPAALLSDPEWLGELQM